MGNTYTFGLQGPAIANQPVFDAGPGVYTVGAPITNGSLSPGLADLNFSIEIEPPSAPVPTLSQWGIMILLLSLLIIGTVTVAFLAKQSSLKPIRA